jgi:hypothetical protein
MPRKTNGELRARGDVLVEEFYRWRAPEPVEVVVEEFEPELTPELARRGELALASGISDEGMLRILTDLDIETSVLTALSLVPLVEVAWADGRMNPEERAAILDASGDHGISPDSSAHALLASWLEHLPRPELFEAWRSYIEAVFEPLTPGERQELRTGLVERARRVAEAAGGILGVGAISGSERLVLARLDEVLREASEKAKG